MEFVQELVIAVELSEVLGVAIAVGEEGLEVMPNLAERTVKQLHTMLKSFGCKSYSKLKKLELVQLAIAAYKPVINKGVGKSKTTKAKSARKRK